MFDFLPIESPNAPAKMRVLSISGGGLLGVIPAAVLMHYEALGQRAYGSDYRISDSFDLVGGSSTGAVIATGVALGLSATEIADFYLRDVPQGFKRRRGAVPLIHDLFDGDLMQRFFRKRTEGRCLDRGVLNCHLAITAKNLSHARPMVFSTLPETAECGGLQDIEHRRDTLPLDLLLRASTAAPGLFSPVPLSLTSGEDILAGDGGLSTFNDPGHVLARLAWNSGADMVALTSLGTGNTRPTYSASRLTRGPSGIRALRALLGVIKDGEAQTRQILESLSSIPGSPLEYRNVDMGLDRATFEALGMEISNRDLARMRSISGFGGKVKLFEAAQRFAAEKISAPLPLANRMELAWAV